jgi:ABC-type branched-subunit amino acid transport system permease subunit
LPKGINFNWLAFLLGPFYFLAKGLWRQALVYVLLAIALVTLLEFAGLGQFGRAVGYGLAAIYAVRANVSYDANVVQGQAPWI